MHWSFETRIRRGGNKEKKERNNKKNKEKKNLVCPTHRIRTTGENILHFFKILRGTGFQKSSFFFMLWRGGCNKIEEIRDIFHRSRSFSLGREKTKTFPLGIKKHEKKKRQTTSNFSPKIKKFLFVSSKELMIKPWQ